MTALVNSQSGGLQVIERTDEQQLTGGQCGFAWCEVEHFQDAFCGDGISQMESRDDDAPVSSATDQIIAPLPASNSFVNEKLKSFSPNFGRTQTMPMKVSRQVSVGEDGGNPAMMSNAGDIKITRSLSVSAPVVSDEKSKYYEQFMARVDIASKKHGSQSLPVADLYVKMGTECIQKKNSDAKSKELALLLFEEAFSIYQAKSGDSHDQTVSCRIHLGKAYHSLGRYDEALDCFCMAVYMREAMLGELHPSVSEVWVLVASVHQAKSKLELALKASAKALTGYRNAYGDKHPAVIAVLKEIAQIHVEMGNNDKAVDIQKYVRLHSPNETTAEF